MQFLGTPPAGQHSRFEDAQGLLVGTALTALGVHLLRSADLMTGQIAGLSLVLAQASGLGFGMWFFALNLPFYWLAWQRMGPVFAVKSFVCVAMLSLLVEALQVLAPFGALNTPVAALLAGACAGTGLLVLFRHGASLGGVGIVGLYLQDRYGFKAGWSQLIFDFVVFGMAFFLFPPLNVVYSLLGAVVLNVVIATNHRRDRYIAQ